MQKRQLVRNESLIEIQKKNQLTSFLDNITFLMIHCIALLPLK